MKGRVHETSSKRSHCTKEQWELKEQQELRVYDVDFTFHNLF